MYLARIKAHLIDEVLLSTVTVSIRGEAALLLPRAQERRVRIVRRRASVVKKLTRVEDTAVVVEELLNLVVVVVVAVASCGRWRRVSVGGGVV